MEKQRDGGNLAGEAVTLLDMSYDDLRRLVDSLGEPPYRAEQVAGWLYTRKIERVDEMTNVPRRLRESLAERSVGRVAPTAVTESADGTRKYLYAYGDRYVEAAYIPEVKRATLCLSTQCGCRMGCRFCATGRQGFGGNLSAGDILNQRLSLPEGSTVTNIVYMGMGEPLDNIDAVLASLNTFTSSWGMGMSAKRITVSTVGVLPALRRLIDESNCHIAVSLHSPFDEERRGLMPVQNRHPIRDVVDVLRSANFGTSRRLSFEYIVFHDVNHTRAHVKEIARLVNGLSCRINLIRYHGTAETPAMGSLSAADDSCIEEFQLALKSKGIPTTIRASRGRDVAAACGMLSTHRGMIERR